MFIASGCRQSNTLSLQGNWYVTLDPENEQLRNSTAAKITGKISLPASLAEAGLGVKTEGSDFGILTPEYKYTGKAWYEKEIKIPSSWEGKNVELFLERVLWESRVFVDEREVSVQDALGTPHIHMLGKLKPGSHKLVIRVDNEMIHNIGDKGHAYGRYTQSIWNGIVGKIEIRAKDDLHISLVRTFPDINKDQLKIEVVANSLTEERINLSNEIISLSSGKTILKRENSKISKPGENRFDVMIPLNDKLEKWSEFNPEVYILRTEISSESQSDVYETEFGFYEVSHNGTKILMNGQPLFLRGNLDCVHFPLTGYASCKVEDWERIFRIYKNYGLNHARFHSWCPPEAAFKAANRIGVYLQAEASIWIDWWMSTDMVSRGRPEMDTKGHPKGLGYDEKRDRFVIAEMSRMMKYYGNNPSFIMFCIGNELGNSDFDVMKQWIADLKKNDPRRLYAVSTARKITEVDDYSATHYIQDVGRTRGLNGPRTNWDFEESYGQMNIPIIAHEIGQWPVYPKWSEIDKYQGVLKARNFEEFRSIAEKNGIADQDLAFCWASGALNQLMYKYETESFLRTPSCAGVQLLSMQDYQGQGEALIGWLDSHWESKGIVTPEKFREHYNTTVPLLRMEKFIWKNSETFKATAQLSHHGQNNLQANCIWRIMDEAGRELAGEAFALKEFEVGMVTSLGEIKFDLGTITRAQKLRVEIEVSETEFHNEWEIWVYPRELPAVDISEVLVVNEITDEVIENLESGAKVLLMANGLGTRENTVNANFYPLYWSLTFFPGQGKTNIGLLLKNEHPAFADFPTDSHSNWQWETICSDAKGFILNQMPAGYKPIAQPVDDFHRNNKIGAIFEFKVGKGKLLVCGYNIENEKSPVANQLKYSLLRYVNSDKFVPSQQAETAFLKEIFEKVPDATRAEIPPQFKDAQLFIEAAALMDEEDQVIAWNKKYDRTSLSEGFSYQLSADGIRKSKEGTAWLGKEIILTIHCPDGILGELFVHFTDWNNRKREGLLDFEDRKANLGKHPPEGQWVKFHVMREDSNDGKIILQTSVTKGGNLMIDKVALVTE